MFATMRKHHKWLLGVIVVITAVSMVSWQSLNRSSDSGRGEGNLGSIDDKKITRTEYENAMREAYLRYFFSTGDWPDKGRQKAEFDRERETYQRLFMIRKLEQYNIEVDDNSVAQTAHNILSQVNRGKPVTLDEFAKSVLGNYATVNDFERFIRHDLGIQQLLSVVGTGGKLTTPQEAQALYERNHEELATEAVFFNGSNFIASVSAGTPETIAQFYTNQMAYYRVPDRVQVSYVKFDASNFVAEADLEMAKLTNINAIVDQLYLQRGTNYYRDAKTPDDAKQKIRAEVYNKVKLGSAQKKANEFANELFAKEPQRPENLEALAKEKGLIAKVTAPFDQENGPTEFDGGPDFAKTAFALSPNDDPFAGPIIGKDSVFVIAYNKQVPSAVPPLETIRDRVANDYKQVQAVMQARLAGQQFVQKATNDLAQGKTFAAICSEAGVKPTAIQPFSLSARELPEVEKHLSLNQYKQITFSLAPGKVSEFNPTLEGGVVVYVRQKLPVDQARMKADMPAFIKMVRQQREQEAFNEWFRREADKGLRDTPLNKPRQTVPGM
jgi:parvulin-like peptidyl-prolyl isomerase